MKLSFTCLGYHPRSSLAPGLSQQAEWRGCQRTPSRLGSEVSDSSRLGSQARQILAFQGVANQLLGGHFGRLLTELGSPGQRLGTGPGAPGPGGSPASALSGKVQELQSGQRAMGANGTQVERGDDGVVRISFADTCGTKRNLLVHGDRLSLDGGKTFQPLGNRGQILKLPNGDVVAVGNAERPGGSKVLSRVAVTDSVERVTTDEQGKTNVYDVGEALKREGGSSNSTAFSMSLGNVHGQGPNLSATFASFSGLVVTPERWRSELRLSHLGQK